MSENRIETIRQFWLGPLTGPEDFPVEKAESWFKASEETDALIRAQFLSDWEQAAQGDLEHWRQTPRGTLALVILLDQFSRNLFRGKPEAWEQDPTALQLALNAIEQGIDQVLYPVEAIFLYLPLEHSEELAIQEKSVGLYRSLAEAAPLSIEFPMRNVLDYAQRHHKVIEQFGRFPHRNDILGRISTSEEVEFLAQPGSSF